ncbi:MAG: BatA domain-containing protein [Planctomycetes bacterium]|nr:BatA domain-containing protein [Planctomycetota bacterium]
MLLNPALLLWLGLAGAPIVIHLLNRRRYRTLHWGAMQFLEESVAKSSRRLRLEQLLILLLRTLIVAFIVYAMARPFLPGVVPGLPAARPKRNVVVVLDGSLSMRYDEHRISTFARAKENVANIIGALEKGDSLNVVVAGAEPLPLVPEPIVDHDRIISVLKDIEPGGSDANFALAFEEAQAQLDKSHNPIRQIYVVTDKQSFGWHAESDGHWFAALARLQRARRKPAVYVLPVGAQHRENAAVTSLTPAHDSVGIYQETRFDVRVSNFGKEDREKLNVSFSLEGTVEQVIQADVPAGEAASVSFHHKFSEAGSHLVRVRIDTDALPADDEMTTSVDVYDAIPVLLADGSPDRTALTRPGPLELALCPRDKDHPELKTLLAPEVVRADEMPDLSTSKHHLVILHDVPKLTHRQVSEIEAFVDAGGGLLVFPGEHTDVKSYNSLLYRDTDGPLPATLELAQGTEQPVRGMAQAFTHPALAAFRDPKHGDFTLIEALRHFKLAPDPADEHSRVLARLANGDPLLVEKAFGQGRAIVCAVPIDGSWTNLQKRSFFVPLIHYMAYYLAGSVHPLRNVPLGSPISRLLPLDSKDKFLEVYDPEDEMHGVVAEEKGDRLVATFSGTDRPGVYRIEEPEAGRSTYYVVRSPTGESNLAALDPRETIWIEEKLGAVFAQNWADLHAQAFKESKQLREFWQLIVVLVIGLVLLETFLTGRFAKRLQRG